MKTFPLWMQATLLSFCCLAMTSCEINNDSAGTEDNYAKIAGTRWQLSEVFNENNVWVKDDLYPDLRIPDLRFGTDRDFEIKVYSPFGYSDINAMRGSYSISYNTISFVQNGFLGVFLELRITSLNDSVLEGVFTIWGDDEHTYDPQTGMETIRADHRSYTVRLKRF